MHPGWIPSRVWRQRDSFSTINSTVAVQTKGLGFSSRRSENPRWLFQGPPRYQTTHGGFSYWSTPQTNARPDSANWNWWGKMRNEAGMTLQPGLQPGMLVRAVVVHHQVQGTCPRKFLVQTPQKSQEFLVTMSFEALTDQGPLQDFQCCMLQTRSLSRYACNRASSCRSGPS